jgi:radical SAM protein with 4Fe4S-binding SPASM domain
MRNCPRKALAIQRSPTVRLRRESWGGIAFNHTRGDMLELDAAGFAALSLLSAPQSLFHLRDSVRGHGHALRLPELAAFVKALERLGLVREVPAEAPALAPGRCKEPARSGAGELSAPLVAHWAVTYRCNLQCSFCYAASGPHREPGPEAGVRLRLVERLADWGVLEVALGGGEPAILPDFPDLLAAIRAAGMVPNVTTNGTVQTPRVVRALADHAGVVHLSADRPELLDAARGRGVCRRLRATARALRQAGVRLGVNLLLTPANVADIRRSLEAALELGVQAVTLLRPKGEWAGANWPGFPAAADLETLAAGLWSFLAVRPPLRFYVDTALRGEWVRLGLLEDPEPEVRGCGGGQRHTALTPEGDVYPCSHLRRPEFRMGNLLEEEGTRLWSRGMGWEGRRRYLDGCRGMTCPCCPGEGAERGCHPSLGALVMAAPIRV